MLIKNLSMPKQNYLNHVRYYTCHHFIFYPVLLAGMILSIYACFHYPQEKRIWLAVTALLLLFGWLSFMMRQHYALGNQDRIVRMEMRFRYYVITGKRLEPLEANLRFSQLAALRFAADEELPALLEQTLRENLSPGEIKKSIAQWQPDTMRV